MLAAMTSIAWASPFQVGLNVNLAMAGNTGVSRVVDETSWAVNPAALPYLDSAAGDLEDDVWQKMIGGSIDVAGDTDITTLNLAAKQFGRPYGMGLGYIDVFDTEIIGVGFGRTFGRGNVSWGINYMNMNPDAGDNANVLSAGIYGKWDYDQDAATGVLRYGAVVRDLTSDFLPKRIYDAGLATTYAGLDVAFDLVDISDEVDRVWRCGVTKTFATRSGDWTVGAGLDDNDLTAGVNYAWSDENQSFKVGLAWHEVDEGDADDDILASVGYARNLGF